MTREADIEAMEKRALEIEGDSDNPLRVAAANKYWRKAAKLRSTLSDKGTASDVG